MSKIADILRQLMKEHALSESELSRRTGIGQPVIHRIASGQTIDPKVNTLSAIAVYLNISISQLIGDAPLPEKFMPSLNQAPLISWEDAVNWPANKEKLYESSVDYCLTEANVSSDVYALKIKDTAMQPLFPENTILIIDPVLKMQDKDYVIIHIEPQKQVIFRQALFDGQYIYLKTLNPDFKVTVLDLEKPGKKNKPYKFLGVLVQSRGDFR